MDKKAVSARWTCDFIVVVGVVGGSRGAGGAGGGIPAVSVGRGSVAGAVVTVGNVAAVAAFFFVTAAVSADSTRALPREVSISTVGAHCCCFRPGPESPHTLSLNF